MKKFSALVAGVAMATSLLVPLAAAPAAHADSGGDAAAFVGAINALRVGRGTAPLTVDVRLTNLGTWWAGQMATRVGLAHNPNLAGMLPSGWTLGGENVGVGGNEPSLESAFENSPEHFANMMNPTFTAIGIGVVRAGSRLWVSEEYTAGVAPIVAPPQWTGWSASPGSTPPGGLVGALAVASWGVNRFDQFARGGDKNLWHRWSADGGVSMSAWESLGAPAGGLTSSPAAVSWSNNRIDVFGRGGDNGLWHLWWGGASWAGWENLGGVLSSAPTVSSWSAGRLDVFMGGSDHAIWHKWYDNGWSGFESHGGYGAFDPAATSWGRGRIDLFTVGSTGALYHSWWDGARWSGWVNEVAGTWSSGPGAASWGPGRVDVFLSGGAAGNPMIHAWYGGGWYSESLAGSLSSAPAAASWASNRLDAFVRGSDGNLYHDAYRS